MNNFNNLQINISKLFKNLNFRKNLKHYNRPWILRFFYRFIIAVSYKLGLHQRLVNSGFILTWFYEFRDYWSNVLGGRPLYLNDFYFLLGFFRIEYQNVKVDDNSSEVNFLNAWQNEKALYQLFGAIRRFSLEPLYCYRYEKWIKSGDRVLEYGCGVAPLANSLLKYTLKLKLKITIADIQQINSHFASWRLGKEVEFISLSPFKKNLTQKYDKIFLITVLEHLPNPLEVIKELKNALNNNGLLIFDYIKSEGQGLDTLEAVNDRAEVLSYISIHFDIIVGELKEGESMGTTVAKIK